ncbi:MAG TPA: ABC transporter ATP-binding protein [Pirellulaceae bacterium]|nr:ABC transporter ATP-binding protein [Pirellulaceae bacterium]
MFSLEARHVSKSYPTRGEPLVVLRDASLELNPGESVAIVGPSGSGKSTLLHILGTLDSPSGGAVTLGGQNPFALSESELATFRNRHIGFVFQEHHLLPQLSVFENVLVPALADGTPTDAQAARAAELIERVGLGGRLDHRPAELSGGERQRVALARALLLEPKLLLADEPTGSLDRTNAQAVGRLLLELQAAERTMLVVVTHSLELAELLQRRLTIDDGLLR